MDHSMDYFILVNEYRVRFIANNLTIFIIRSSNMSEINFTFDNDSLDNYSFKLKLYRLHINQPMTLNNIKILESARSTIFSTQNKCTQQSFDSICKELITQWPTAQEVYEDSLQKYEPINEKNSLQTKIKRLSVIFNLLKKLKELQRGKSYKKDLSQIENCFLQLQRDCLNN